MFIGVFAQIYASHSVETFIRACSEHNLPPNLCEAFSDRRQRESFEQNAELNEAFAKRP